MSAFSKVGFCSSDLPVLNGNYSRMEPRRGATRDRGETFSFFFKY